MVLATVPFIGVFPDDLQLWLSTHRDNSSLASALAAVSNHTGSLFHDLGNSQDYWTRYAFNKWWQLEQSLYQIITKSMIQSNQNGFTNYNLSESRLHYRVNPFMEMHGFYDSDGWWIKQEDNKRF